MAKRCSRKFGCKKPRANWWRKSLGVDWLHSAGLSSTPTTEYDAFWIIGDSLARGASDPLLPGPTPTSGTVYEWHNDTLVEVTTADLVDAIDGSPWPQFGINYNLNTERKVVFFNSAIGGSTITNADASGKWWSTTGPGTLWQDALDELAGITSITGGATIRGTIISGGVNDYRQAVKPTAAEFKTAYQDLINRVNAATNNAPIYLFHVAAVGTTDSLGGEYRIKVLELIDENSNVHLGINTNQFGAQGYLSADEVHFIQAGNNKAGEQLARYIKKIADGYSKTIAQVLARFDTELTAPAEALWISFINACNTHGNWDALDVLQVYVAATEKNTQFDVMDNVIRGDDAPTFNAYDNLATNGSSTYVYTGYRPNLNNRRATQEDIFVACKSGTYSTSAGTTAYLYGSTTSGTAFYIFQNTNGINYRINDNTARFWNGETQFASNTVYGMRRSGGTKYLYKNKTNVDSFAAASTTPSTRSVPIGARGNGSSSFDGYSQMEAKYFVVGSWSLLGSYDDLIDDLNTLVAGLEAL